MPRRIVGVSVLAAIFQMGCTGQILGDDDGMSASPNLPADGSGGEMATGGKGASEPGPNAGKPGSGGSGSTPGGGGPSAGGDDPGEAGAPAAGGSGQGGSEDPPGSGGSAAPIDGGFSRLTRAEYGATVRSALGIRVNDSLVPVDGRVGPFTSNAAEALDPVHPYLLAAEELASEVIPDELPACDSDEVESCLEDEYRAPIERLYRRSLTRAEMTALSDLFTNLVEAGASEVDATRAMLASALVSPDFLYRSASLPGDTARARRLAEHLSYALWDAPPDADLVAAVDDDAGPLGERLAEEAARMSRDARAVPVIARFLAQWLRVDVDLRLEDRAFASSPQFLELLALAEDALTNAVPVSSLISGERGFVHEDNASLYGLDSIPGSSEVAVITWPADSGRRGILAQELFADATRHPDATRRPIFRGLLVRRSLLCESIPPPPAGLLESVGEVTDRLADARCSSCHTRIDPVGRAFAVLDADAEDGPLTAELLEHPELGGTYADLGELLTAVAGSRAFAECFARQWLGFFLEHAPEQADAAWVAEVADLVQAGASLPELIERTITTLEARSADVTPWCEGP
ncbi:MAG TPA: DUF1592 domain-containing protein [Polyangiaceae bacterium]|nr:DUF1592 domain-containing protein [Polyangiaceae bacterium]